MSNPNPTRLPYCGNLTYGQIAREMHRIYDNSHPDLSPWKVERIHTDWRRIGKLVKAGRL